MKRQICIDARMMMSSGIGTYIRSVISKLRSKYSIDLIVKPKESIPQELSQLNLISCLSPIYSIQEQIALPYIIPKCDLFFSPHFNIPLGPIRARKRLVTIHDLFFLACPDHLGFHQRLYSQIMFNAAVRKSDHVITDSMFSLSEMKKYLDVDADKVSVIPLGIDSNVYRADPRKPSITIPKKFILYVGNLAIHKNISRLIQSLDFLPEDIHLILVGKETWWKDWKSEAAQRKNRVISLGYVNQAELNWLYQHAQMLVHPSFYEGFGLTPLEAMSAGCPVVVANAASLPEVCGDAAIYIDPKSAHQIAQGILSLLNDRERRNLFVKQGLMRVQTFCWDLCAEKHVKIIDSLIAHSNRM